MSAWILIKEFVLSAVGNVLYFISFFIPKKKHLWVFGGLLGKGYNDNSKYFFEYVNRAHPEIEAVWITQDKKVVKKINQKGYSAFAGYSLTGCWILMRAGAAVISHSRVRDLKPFVITPQVKFVQLWHGIPLKKIEFDDKIFFNKPSIITRLSFFAMEMMSPAFRRRFDMFIACSEQDKKSFSSAFRLDPDRIKITGYPRNDALLNSQKTQKESEYKKILYVPTFRGMEGAKFELFEKFGFDPVRLNTLLKENKMVLDIKLHPYNRPTEKLLKEIENKECIRFYDGVDIYDSMGSFDVLITDFSSIYFDFLLLDRPIIFAPFDMDQYINNDRELYYTYDEITPGPKVHDWKSLEYQLACLTEKVDVYSNKRQSAKKQFHRFHDSGSSERVYQAIMKLF